MCFFEVFLDRLAALIRGVLIGIEAIHGLAVGNAQTVRCAVLVIADGFYEGGLPSGVFANAPRAKIKQTQKTLIHADFLTGGISSL